MRVADQPTVKADLHAIMNAKTLPKARSAAWRFADQPRWAGLLTALVGMVDSANSGKAQNATG